jgi:hypothetical protein
MKEIQEYIIRRTTQARVGGTEDDTSDAVVKKNKTKERKHTASNVTTSRNTFLRNTTHGGSIASRSTLPHKSSISSYMGTLTSSSKEEITTNLKMSHDIENHVISNTIFNEIEGGSKIVVVAEDNEDNDDSQDDEDVVNKLVLIGGITRTRDELLAKSPLLNLIRNKQSLYYIP